MPIDRLNEKLRGITLLKGIEVDILEDGRLDLADAALARLGLVVRAVHSAFVYRAASRPRASCARDAGVPVVVSSDAHRGADFRWLRLGIDQARRGWLEPGDVLNTLPLLQLRKRLAVTMHRAVG